ncbi:MAG TPA: ATP-dependent RecD-like DNA helicase [Ruminococcaceae bacterium]|nr:ATP-dependent RecD-like DNA helicase [Oscillospiraceae bacterium]
MQKDVEQLEGTVENIIYRNDESGYTVMELSDGEQLFTVVGVLLGIDIGELLKVTGKFATHPTYGYQIKASLIERTLPSSANAIGKYLSSGAIKGIGPSTALKLVEQFGDKTLEIIESSPEKLTIIKGISKAKAIKISEEYRRLFGIRTVMLFLSKYGIDTATSIRVWRLWGMSAPDAIKANPYSLCCDELAISFERADEIAGSLGFLQDNPLRIKAGIAYVLRHNLFNGHTCAPSDKLISAADKILKLGSEKIDDALYEMINDEELICVKAQGADYIYLPNIYGAETYCAGRIKLMLELASPQKKSYEKDITELEKSFGIKYAALQRKAINAALNENVFILTGGPGTGKTTTLNAIITLLEKNGFKTALTAPTGRAAKRMSEVTGCDAKTIHRLLEVDFKDENGKNKFKRNEKNPLPYDAVIIDEMSMVDIQLFECLIRALKLTCKLIMVGDPDQLPSVGAGNVLSDLITSDTVNAIHLDEVFRQAAQSLIVTNAHCIVRGELPNIFKTDSDFFFLKQSSYQQTADTVISLCKTRLPKAYGYSPLWDIQVIAPTRVGKLGTIELNRCLQQAFNPPSEEKRDFKTLQYTFREGDKVMQIKNNYDIIWKKDDGEQGTGIFNGDIGIIDLIDRPSQSILIRYDDKTAEYTFDMADELELAYAVTVHKSQGSEFEAVVMPLMDYNSRMYYRNLLYTAVTRAKKLLVMLGNPDTVRSMVANNRKTLRYTNLKGFLNGDLR